jgi:itaconate CoA-transferase
MDDHILAALSARSGVVRPLDGITVVSLEHAIAAPFATRQLADLGARVIKIERLGSGDFARNYDTRVGGLASHFVWTNRSKESVALDIKNPKANKHLLDLVKSADVFVQNLAPGAAARLGLSEELLRTECPRLIICDISGYGMTGPHCDRKAYDLLIQSEAGFLSVTGTPNERVKASISLADICAGMYAYSGILSALLLRDKTGKGSHIDLSMLESLSEWMSYPLYYAYKGAPPPPRTGASHATIFPYGLFVCGDGRSVMLGLQNEREWSIFCRDVLDRPDLIADPRFNTNVKRVENRLELTSEIEATFLALTAEDVVKRLDDADIANASVRNMADVWAHPQLEARNRWTEIDSPVGKIPALLPPAQLDGVPSRMDPIPELGEHTKHVLRELGLPEDEIEELCKVSKNG